MTNHNRRRLLLQAPAFLAVPLFLAGCGEAPIDTDEDVDNAARPRQGKSTTVKQGSGQKPVVALTFDDGPHPTLTPKLLEILDDRNIRATFYVVGHKVERHPALVKRIRREGHEIGNHSWSHANLANRSDEMVLSELRRTNEAVQKATGRRPTTMRPPFGAMLPRQSRLVQAKLRMPTVLWSIDSLDYTGSSSATITNRILRRAHNGAIILNHDIHARTIQAMPATIEGLKKRGSRFVTVSKLIG